MSRQRKDPEVNRRHLVEAEMRSIRGRLKYVVGDERREYLHDRLCWLEAVLQEPLGATL
jgi:hypothetical protein